MYSKLVFKHYTYFFKSNDWQSLNFICFDQMIEMIELNLRAVIIGDYTRYTLWLY